MRRAVNIDELPAETKVDRFGFPVEPVGEVVQAEDEAPIQRILGGYMPIEGMPGWYTREMTLRQEIELADMAEELQTIVASEGVKASYALRAALPIAKLVIFRRNKDGDILPVSADDILDNFKSVPLLEIVRGVSGFGQQAGATDPLPALPTTAQSSAG